MFIKLLNEWVYYLFNGLLAFYWVTITTNGDFNNARLLSYNFFGLGVQARVSWVGTLLMVSSD